METIEPNTPPLANASSEMPAQGSHWRRKADRFLGGAMEAIILIAVCASPWCLGAVGTTPRLFLHSGLLLLLALWGARMLLQGGIAWQKCPVTIVLALLFLSGIWQLTPLPPAVLGVIAPGTARVYEQMLPAQPEVLPDHSWKPVSASGTRISLNPQATRTEIMELLAVLLLFALVRNNIPARPGLYRLSLCALANGVLLTFFALLTWYPPLDQLVHGAFFTEEGAFGSFASREHFVFYIEICLGLGTGVFLNRLRAHATPSNFRFHLLAVAMAAGVAILLGGLVFAFSLGGLVAVAVAALLGWLLLLPDFRWRLALALGLLLGTIVLVASIGWEAWASQYSRWIGVLGYIQEFPLWGTGYGTFSQVAANQGLGVETDLQSFGSAPGAFQVMLVEGGAVRVVLGLLVVGLVLRLGIQALRRPANLASSGLAMGALFAVAALVMHSVFDSGLHVPAISLLATVAAAHLCGLANGGPAENESQVGGTRLVWRLHGLAAPAGALLLLVLGVLLLGHARRADAVEQFAQAAVELNLADDRNSRSRQMQLLETAVQLAPADAHLRLELAQAHVRLWHKILDETQREDHATQIAQIVGAVAMQGDCAGRLCPAGNIGAWWPVMNWQELEREKEAYLEDQHLLPALQHCIEARNLFPLDPEPHLRIAALARMADKADAPGVYRDRAKRIAPHDPWVLYQCGVQESESGQGELAWVSWKQSLELSDAFLIQILERYRHQMPPADLRQRILAKRPQQLASAANYLFPDPDARSRERQQFSEEILQLLKEQASWRAGDYHLAATAYVSLGLYPQGRDAFEKALADDPQQVVWRYEFALFSYRHGHYQETHHQLLTILEHQPQHKRAQDFLLKVKDRLGN